MMNVMIVSDTDSVEGANVCTTENTNEDGTSDHEESPVKEKPREREASSQSTGMNEWIGERWDTVTCVCSYLFIHEHYTVVWEQGKTHMSGLVI